jgi:hypothetical protein
LLNSRSPSGVPRELCVENLVRGEKPVR